MVSNPFGKIRSKIKRRRQSIEGRRRARARSRKRGPKARKKAEKERRIEQNDPESLTETVQVAAKEAKGAAEEASKLKSETKEFVETEVSAVDSKTESARGVGERVADVVAVDEDMDDSNIHDPLFDGGTNTPESDGMLGGGDGSMPVDPSEPILGTPQTGEPIDAELEMTDPAEPLDVEQPPDDLL